jgi:hypothetical protein
MNRQWRTVLMTAALFLLAGGTLQAAAHHESFSATAQTWPYQLGAWATVVGCIALATALPRLGLASTGATTAAVVGSCLLAGLAFAEASVNPAIADAAPELLDGTPSTSMAVGLGLSTVAFAVGWLTLGSALLRRGGRRGAPVAVVVAAVVSFVPMVPGPAVVGLALIWLATTTEPDPAKDRRSSAATAH